LVEWDAGWPTLTSQEISLRDDVLKLLAKNGYDPNNLSLSRMEFKEPEPAEKAG
jgi:hypothetical protein